MFENVLLALESLRANKMRAVLTMLGIIIGIAAVIAIISLGNSLTQTMNESMASMGVNNIYVQVSQRESSSGRSESMGNVFSGGWRRPDDKDMITLSQIKTMAENFSDQIAAYSLSESMGSGQVKKGDAYANVSVTGVNAGYATVNDVTITNGSFIDDAAVDKGKNVCVVSDKLVSAIFGEADPIGEVVKVYLSNSIKQYTIVGVYEYEDSFSMGQTVSDADISTDLYIPVTTAQNVSGSKGFTTFTVMGSNSDNVETFTTQLTNYWTRIYRNNQNWTASASNMQSMVSMTNDMMSMLSVVLAVIAGISLLVGGIGVMNIMLVSVTERTREIGIRKALGAQNAQIRVQFVVEAAILCVIGGIIGIIFGLAIGAVGAQLVGAMMGMESSLVVSIPVIFGTMTFSLFIGVFFGYYPANKAAKLDPIDALRYE